MKLAGRFVGVVRLNWWKGAEGVYNQDIYLDIFLENKEYF